MIDFFVKMRYTLIIYSACLLWGLYMIKRKPFFGSSLAVYFSDDAYRYSFQLRLLCVILGTVSLIMGIMNIFTHKRLLMIATLSFAFISYLNYADMKWLRKKCDGLNFGLFTVSIIILFTYFLVTGGTEGFSPIWILILPSCGMMFLGKKRGGIVSALMYLIVIYLLWFPSGKQLLTFAYTKEFCMRFPVVYGSFFVIGYSFELIRLAAYNAMVEMQKQLTSFAETDTLTQVPNRHWFNERLEKFYTGVPAENEGAMLLFDIDDFKAVNDLYGHRWGDEVLVQVAQAIRSQLRSDDMFCRWGGEEFFAFLPNCPEASIQSVCDRIRSKIAEIEFCSGDRIFHVSISIGAVKIYKGLPLNSEACFNLADKKLYEAKAAGKNCVMISY